ncbi:MAG TPA: argininosuccinate lyase [Gemmatimonadaceae bacterium]
MTAESAASPKAHKLWGGRFATGPAADFDALNNSIGFDFRLWPHDIRLSVAWAQALVGAGVLTSAECKDLENGLAGVTRRLEAGEVPGPGDEDIHTLIDRLLHAEVGDVASKLHTGRSRNDQVATATRLWVIDACGRMGHAIRQLQSVLVDRAAEVESALMPGYTHLQRAIPVSAAHWLLSHFWPLERDRARIHAAAHSAATLPLGSGALAGCAYPVSRDQLRGALGFESVSQNSMDAVSDRDFVAEVLFSCTLTATHLSRLAEDLIIYGSSEFSFVQFGDAYSSGSSMMPQKRNPDALELTRGAAARLLGSHVSLLATLKGLPSTYNKDLQDDKRALFDAVDTLSLVLPAVGGALGELKFRTDRMRSAVTSTMMATDLADYLVRKGATFREAHGAVGKLVRLAENDGTELSALPFSTFGEAHRLFAKDVYQALEPERSVALRDVDGGTGPGALRRQLEAARAAVTA